MTERTAEVLNLHRISPRCYDLSSVRTGSVRDQLIRSTLLADALLASKLVVIGPTNEHPAPEPERKKILVLGAGVAGICLALTAAESGADVTILERRLIPFGTVRDCNWRTIDPTEYDWPHPHWKESTLPFPLPGGTLPTGVSLPLPPGRLTGKGLADIWDWMHRHILFPASPGQRVAVGKGTVSIFYGFDADSITIDDELAARALSKRRPGQAMLTATRVTMSPLVEIFDGPTGQGENSEKFAAVVSCIGFGDEVTFERPHAMPAQWGGYRGPRFWLDDDHMRPDRFFPVGNRTPTSILISGAGDGAMQDFQRAATGLFGRDLYEKIENTVGAKSFVPERVMQAASLAEDYARRAHAFRVSSTPIGESLAYWEDTYAKAVHEVWGGWRKADRDMLAMKVLRPEILSGLGGGTATQVRLLWVCEGRTLTFAYGLNRFLSLLLLRLMEHLQGAAVASVNPVLRTQHKISKIAPKPGHTCTGFSAHCYTHMHEVTFQRLDGGKPWTRDFDLIIVRHGQDHSSILGGAAVPEQQIPLDLPR
ncbi:NAD(P)-binding protein [Burkholderia cepacia]|uniref:NAD(P)-binding protein n=1 Tax=Burkholderia cepacia TaxID=292 RepID=UPI003EDF18E9